MQEEKITEDQAGQNHPIVERHFPVVTLCGSTRFRKDFEETMKTFTLEGYIVISVGCFGHSDPDPRIRERKTMLDEMHLRKIDMADSVFVINTGGYIGESTRREIAYARSKGKVVNYLYRPDAPAPAPKEE